jgi:hypothetical protein
VMIDDAHDRCFRSVRGARLSAELITRLHLKARASFCWRCADDAAHAAGRTTHTPQVEPTPSRASEHSGAFRPRTQRGAPQRCGSAPGLLAVAVLTLCAHRMRPSQQRAARRRSRSRGRLRTAPGSVDVCYARMPTLDSTADRARALETLGVWCQSHHPSGSSQYPF